jgi:hypothetical protein
MPAVPAAPQPDGRHADEDGRPAPTTAPRVGGTTKLLRWYVIGHAVALAAFWFVPNTSWLHSIWQSLVTSASVVFMLLGVRRLRPEGAAAWYFIGAGVFLNAWGVAVEITVRRLFGVASSPTLADVFWSALFPGATVGLLMLLRRAVAREDQAITLLNTVICVPVTFFAGIHAWQFLVWQTPSDPSVALAYRIVVIAYPFGDLMFATLLLRMVLSIGVKNVSMLLMLGWLALLFPSDLGWPTFVQTETLPGRAMQYFMEATWMAAQALLSLSTWHPDVRGISRSVDRRVPPLGALGWTTLLACALTGPLVVLLQIVLDRRYSLTSF